MALFIPVAFSIAIFLVAAIGADLRGVGFHRSLSVDPAR